MKKKQKDDIMGEEESDLPINEGKAKSAQRNDDTNCPQWLEGVLTRIVTPSKHISINYRHEVPMNRLLRSSRYVGPRHFSKARG